MTAQEHNAVVQELVEKNGYNFEMHSTITEDGYVLGIHRVLAQNFNATNNAQNPPSVLLVHGLLGSSQDWLATGVNRSLAFLLADNGYDVWLGNNRGSTSSKNHTKLSVESPEFWDFSWHEMGLYDAPATIDYVLHHTGQRQIFYIGYSEGNTQFWVLTSLRPEYNEKIRLMLALAPVAYTGNIKGIAKAFTPASSFARVVGESVGYFEFLPRSYLTSNLTTYFCVKNKVFQPLCKVLIHLIGGFSVGEIDQVFLEAFTACMPAGSSIKQLLHYGLNAEKPGHFRPFDYGRKKNQKVYNAPVPPEYPIRKITAPVILYNGNGDYLADVKDVKLLERKLPNIMEKYTNEIYELKDNIPTSICRNTIIHLILAGYSSQEFVGNDDRVLQKCVLININKKYVTQNIYKDRYKITCLGITPPSRANVQ
ncbi:hypothetical protein KM043_012202 [Ampulex compressa]|nr:hypothetical protein KM043_012202 [Ampulex compressa]